MARARQFNRLAEENRARSRSMERRSDAGGGQPQGGGGAGLRGRAMASVRNEYEANAVSPSGAAARHDAPPLAAAHAPHQNAPPAQNGGEQQQQQQPPQQQIVTPELLVDALSGHEDGLLAIAERLMEHYDAGYDAMGEGKNQYHSITACNESRCTITISPNSNHCIVALLSPRT